MNLTDLHQFSIVAYRSGHMRICQRGTASSFVNALEQIDDGTGDYDKVVIEVIEEEEESIVDPA